MEEGLLLKAKGIFVLALAAFLVSVLVPPPEAVLQASFTHVSTEPHIFIPGGAGAELLLDSDEDFYVLHIKNGDVYFRKYNSSHRLVVPDLVLYDNGMNENIDATFDEFGYIHMTWTTTFFGAQSVMYAKIQDNGTFVVFPTKLSGDNNDRDFHSVVGANSLGQAYVVWDYWWNPAHYLDEDVLYAMVDEDGSVNFTQRYVAPAEWQTDFYCRKDVVVDRDDNLHILFDRVDADEDIHAYYKKYASDGTTVLVSEKEIIPVDYRVWSSCLEAELDSQDRINLGFSYGYGGNVETFYARIDLQGNLEVGPIEISPMDSYHSFRASLAVDDYDNSYVFWVDTKDGNREVYYAVVDQNGTVALSHTRLTDTAESESTLYMGAVFDSLDRCYWSYYDEDGTYIVYPVAPVADAGGPYSVNEGDALILSAAGSYDENGDELQYRWDTDADGVWDTTWSDDSNVSVVWGDDINASVRVEVTDGDFSDTDVALVTVKNVDPTIANVTWFVREGGEPRTIGYWKHQCELKFESPDHVGIQQSYIDYISNNSRVFAGISTKSEVCDLLWNVEHRNMTQKAMQQLIALWLNVASGKLRLSSRDFVDHLNKTMSLLEAIDWIEDTILSNKKEDMEAAKDLADETNNGNLFAQPMVVITATASDPGSDDLVFTWDWGDGTSDENIYYNDGIGPDPYPSPEVNPITATDSATHGYAAVGTYTIVLTVSDDDGGSETYTLTVGTSTPYMPVDERRTQDQPIQEHLPSPVHNSPVEVPEPPYSSTSPFVMFPTLPVD